MQKTSLASILILILSFLCYSQDRWVGSGYISDGVRQPIVIHTSKAEAKTLTDRWQAIGEELKTTDSILAGTYILDGNRGSYLRWSPQNGFMFIKHYEHIELTDYSYGKVAVNGTEVTFVTEKEWQWHPDQQKLTVPTSWVVIGKYLIPKNNVKDFAEYLSGLGEYNEYLCECDAFFSKIFPSKAPRFIIPKQYKHLFRPPIEGKIIFAGKPIIHKQTEKRSAIIVTIVKINVGKTQGVKKGLILRIPNYGREVIITKVNPNNSEGTVTDIITDEEKGRVTTYYDAKTEKHKPLPPVRVGTKVTTKLF